MPPPPLAEHERWSKETWDEMNQQWITNMPTPIAAPTTPPEWLVEYRSKQHNDYDAMAKFAAERDVAAAMSSNEGPAPAPSATQGFRSNGTAKYLPKTYDVIVPATIMAGYDNDRDNGGDPATSVFP